MITAILLQALSFFASFGTAMHSVVPPHVMVMNFHRAEDASALSAPVLEIGSTYDLNDVAFVATSLRFQRNYFDLSSSSLSLKGVQNRVSVPFRIGFRPTKRVETSFAVDFPVLYISDSKKTGSDAVDDAFQSKMNSWAGPNFELESAIRLTKKGKIFIRVHQNFPRSSNRTYDPIRTEGFSAGLIFDLGKRSS